MDDDDVTPTKMPPSGLSVSLDQWQAVRHLVVPGRFSLFITLAYLIVVVVVVPLLLISLGPGSNPRRISQH